MPIKYLTTNFAHLMVENHQQTNNVTVKLWYRNVPNLNKLPFKNSSINYEYIIHVTLRIATEVTDKSVVSCIK